MVTLISYMLVIIHFISFKYVSITPQEGAYLQHWLFCCVWLNKVLYSPIQNNYTENTMFYYDIGYFVIFDNKWGVLIHNSK